MGEGWEDGARTLRKSKKHLAQVINGVGETLSIPIKVNSQFLSIETNKELMERHPNPKKGYDTEAQKFMVENGINLRAFVAKQQISMSLARQWIAKTKEVLGFI
jgi:hypothetical protein